MISFTPPTSKQAYWSFCGNVNIRRLYRLNLRTNAVGPAELDFRITRASKMRELRGINIYNIMPVTISVIFQVFESCDHAVDLIRDIVGYDQDGFFWHLVVTRKESNFNQDCTVD
jgi:hypothetical protein